MTTTSTRIVRVCSMSNISEYFPAVFDLVWVPVNEPQRVAA